MPRLWRNKRRRRPQPKDTEPEVIPDFRDDATRTADASLSGTWFRCQDHGLTDAPLLLGSRGYCPHDVCVKRVKLVSRVEPEKTQGTSFGWDLTAGPAVRVVRSEDAVECANCEALTDGPLIHVATRNRSELICLTCGRLSRSIATRNAADGALGG